MKTKLLITMLALISFMGCAHSTPFQTCSTDDKWKDYGTMDECVVEMKAERDARRKAWADAWKPMQQHSKATNCTSQVMGNTISTSCN